IGNYAFSGCSLASRFNSGVEATMAIPESCESIGTEAFKGMGLIANAVVADSVTSIGDGAFEGFTSLESLSIPFVGQSENSSSYSGRVFGYIFGSRSGGSTSSKTSSGSCTYQNSLNYDSHSLLCYCIPASLKTVSVTRASRIPADAFYNCDCIEEINLIVENTEAGANAYYNCNAKVNNTLIATVSCTWDGKLVATAYHGGTGTKSDPYQIFSPKELIYFLNQIRNGETYEGIYFKLTSNINLGGFAIDSTSLTEDTTFKGILDGASHKVFNFTIKSTDNTYNGLFGYMGGTIKNIGFKTSMNITSAQTSDVYNGLIIGNLSGTLENVYASGSLTTTSFKTSYIGGMVGYSTGSIINSYSDVNVTSTSTNLKCYAGGLVGYNDGSIAGSFACGNVSAKGYAEVYSFTSGLVAMEGTNSNVASSFRYEGQVITKFGSSSTSYNEIGTVASLNEIISYCKTNWDGSVWSFKKTLPSF
ncbi:MAG: leucine-rich repeat domain-containing protein, partial [Bacillales bacterium]|nr:leucine-rich repeat domain-containing protein [Bacillales bacterium]